MLTRSTMSLETREVVDSMLDERYRQLVEVLAPARNKTAAEVRALLDEGPYLGGRAQARGLVDAVLYEDDLLAEGAPRITAPTTSAVCAKSAGPSSRCWWRRATYCAAGTRHGWEAEVLASELSTNSRAAWAWTTRSGRSSSASTPPAGTPSLPMRCCGRSTRWPGRSRW